MLAHARTHRRAPNAQNKQYKLPKPQMYKQNITESDGNGNGGSDGGRKIQNECAHARNSKIEKQIERDAIGSDE